MANDLVNAIGRLPGHKRAVVTLSPGRFCGMSFYGDKPESAARLQRFRAMLAEALTTDGLLYVVVLGEGKPMPYSVRIANGKWHGDL